MHKGEIFERRVRPPPPGKAWPPASTDRIAVRPFEPTTARSQRAELAAIRICYAAALNGKFRWCCQLLGRGDATRWRGAYPSERFGIDCGSHDRRVHCQLKHTQAAVVREKRDDGTCGAPILPHGFLSIYRNYPGRQRGV